MHKFLKGQQGKNDKVECDVVLYDLWHSWNDAFPNIKFNKFHGLFCATRDYIRKHGMAGRVSEESLEAFNAVLARMKELLRAMSTIVQRQKKANEHLQGNLKAEVASNSALVLMSDNCRGQL